ncbi:hypothetical protein [Clostridium sp. JNZ J1-5]
MSNEKLSNEKREDILSKYIDTLNDEKKPNYEELYGLESDDELIEVFQTVVAVKKLRENIDDELDTIEIPNIKTDKIKVKNSSLFKRIIATAAMAVILLGVAMTYESSRDIKNAKNIAYAVINKYSNIHNFRGVLQETSMLKDSVDTQKIDIEYEEPNKFYVVSHSDAGDTKKLYVGGDTIYEYDTNEKLTMRTITKDSLEFELSTYRADKKIKEKMEALKNAKFAGEDKIGNRIAEIYELHYNESEIKHKVWIDKELGIALKEVFEDGKGYKHISEFIQFDNDVKIVFPEISAMDKGKAIDERITEEQKAKDEELKNIKEGFKNGQVLQVEFSGLVDSNSAEFKVGDNYFVFGITEKLKNKFSQIKSGKKLVITIGFEDWTTNPVIKEVK